MLLHKMIKDDFKIDFEKKKITYKGNGKKIYSVTEFYSFLQDIFDEQENMKYDIPIVAKSEKEFELINGWTIDEAARKHLTGGILKVAKI